MSRRHNSESYQRDHRDLRDYEYTGTRGSVSASVAAAQARAAGDPRDQRRSGYPGVYRNSEGREGERRTTFDPHEIRPGERLYETPVIPPGTSGRHDLDSRSATHRQVRNASPSRLHPNDRARVAQRPPNDPGPFRVVTAADPNTRDPGRTVGMMEHPAGNPAGYSRMPLAPAGREARAQQQMHDDYHGGSASYPPRGMTADELSRRERDYSRRERGGGRRG